MMIHIRINGTPTELAVAPNEMLLSALRNAGYFSVKHGCETGECGTCAVLMRPVTPHASGAPAAAPFRIANTCVMLAAQADGWDILTCESLGDRNKLSVLQQCFIDNGAIQCGYCTPAQLLAAKALLDRTADPSEAEVREAISGVLCRCTGYLKPVQAILNAARILRGAPGDGEALFRRIAPGPAGAPHAADTPWSGSTGGAGADSPARQAQPDVQTLTRESPRLGQPFLASPEPETAVVGKPEKKVDAAKLAQGKPVFTDDYPMPGMLHAALLTSPHAHARITGIRADRARALPGVHAVLTFKDVPRVVYASGGQSHPNPPPYDQVSLDHKVRHAGDRVAVVAAETPEIAQRALRLIEVDYEPLPAVFDPDAAMAPGAPVIHDEPDAVKIKDASRNLAAQVYALVGDIGRGFAESEVVIEREYRVHQVQQASLEPHVCMTWWDEDDRLVVRTSTQVPFHVRRMLSPLIGLPVKRIRVIKPRVGGGFGGKQEMLIEDLCAHLTLATGRPVRFEFTREQEFTSARSRHPQRIVFKAGFKRDADGAPRLHALRQYVLGNTGAYGAHGLTVQTVSGLRGLSTYNCPHREFVCDIVYTNLPAPGAFRGYGAPQAEFALECLMDEAAQHFGVDPIEFRRPNWVRAGDPLPLAKALGEAREGFEQVVRTCALEECHQQGMAAAHWHERDRLGGTQTVPYPDRPWIRRGIGVASCMHGTAIAGLDMGAASIKMNDDGSFNVAVGATDIGTGSDTVIGQIVAEALGAPLNDIIMHSSDTDYTPFDVGAYASSTTYISGGAAKKAAEQVAQQIREVAAQMLSRQSPVDSQQLILRDRRAWAPDGRSVTLAEVALYATHTDDQHQIMASASHMSFDSPPPFGAQFAEVEVDTQTGEVTVTRLVMAVDCGVAINPATASGQVEGGNVQALGYGISEEMAYDDQGRLLNTRFGPYRIYAADEVPELQAILVQTYEPTGPYGAKAVAEIPMDGVAPAIANAVCHATGKRFYQLPLTPERVWRGLRAES